MRLISLSYFWHDGVFLSPGVGFTASDAEAQDLLALNRAKTSPDVDDILADDPAPPPAKPKPPTKDPAASKGHHKRRDMRAE